MAKKRKKRQGTKVAKAQNDPFDFTNQYTKVELAQNDPVPKEKEQVMQFELSDFELPDLSNIDIDLNKAEWPDFDLEKIQKDLEKSLEGFSMGNQEDDKKEK
jgi:hypothetical protein